METVDELEGQDECQGEQQAHDQPGIKPAEEIEHEGLVTGWLGGANYARNPARAQRPTADRYLMALRHGSAAQ
ncbi:hypothetical protein PSm6_33810 [Pseudomonas solani]|uniref:Uncharacterized protein n=1 Tax=Pseudomonas solani TaxID=2731552 RepID=A0ABN6BWV9_9PSED|nr:hypothetical protein PSm6_33810 [Pseudomonas solani]